MITGTMNVIVAQRLGRRIKEEAKITENVKEKFPEWYESSRQALLTMKPEALDKEMSMREISHEQLEFFTTQGMAYTADPALGIDGYK